MNQVPREYPDNRKRRVLLVNLDFRDVVYSLLWGRAVLDSCIRRNLTVDMATVNPFARRDLAAELGVARSAFDTHFEGTIVYLDDAEESRSRRAIGQLLDRHHYDLLILNCEAPLFLHLLFDRERDLAHTQWLVYDRHLHVDLRARDRDPRLRDRITASGMHLFTIQEIATGSEMPPATDLFPTQIAEGTDFIRSLKLLGFTADRVHFQQWPMDDLFFAAQPATASKDALVVFSGGDTGRDYSALFAAIGDLPIQLRLCAGNYPTPLPPNVTILPRLPLHRFRDEVARASIVIVPLSGHPPVSGITVIAMGKMMAKPVIASDIPVVRMHIRSHGDGGYLAPVGDTAVLRSLLIHLIESPAERERLGQAARAQAAQDLSLRAFVDRMLACAAPAASDEPV